MQLFQAHGYQTSLKNMKNALHLALENCIWFVIMNWHVWHACGECQMANDITKPTKEQGERICSTQRSYFIVKLTQTSIQIIINTTISRTLLNTGTLQTNATIQCNEWYPLQKQWHIIADAEIGPIYRAGWDQAPIYRAGWDRAIQLHWPFIPIA